MIERTHTRTTVTIRTRLSVTDRWVFDAYGFLVKRNETLTIRAFAGRIKRYYSLESRHNFAAYSAMLALAAREGEGRADSETGYRRL
jgi:hypothetical protein